MWGVRYRNGRAEFRVRIPQECLPTWKQHHGGEFFFRALGVSKGDAEERRRAEKATREFREAMEAILHDEYPPMPLTDFERIAARFWKWAQVYEWTPSRIRDDGNLEEVVSLFLKRHRVEDPDDPDDDPIIRVGSGHHERFLNLLREQIAAMAHARSASRLIPAVVAASTGRSPRLHEGWNLPVGVLVERYIAEKHFDRADASEVRIAVKRLEQAIGETSIRKIGVIEKAVGTKAAALIDELDVSRFYKALPLIRNDRGANKYLGEETCNKAVGQIRQFFDWLRNGPYYATPNPFRGAIHFIYPDDKDHERQDEPPESYSVAELNKIFASPFFSGHQGQFVFTPGDIQAREDDRFWIAPVSLFSGMRVSEIADLEFQDIATLYDRDFFCINLVSRYGHEKSTKNDASIRVIPVHRALIQMGFLDWVKKRSRISKDGRIFFHRSEDYSKFWNEKLTRHPLVNVWQYRRKTFHSLRHNFQDALINAAPEMERGTDRLLGHTIDKKLKYGTKTGPHGVIYEHGVLQPEHAVIIDRVAYSGLILPV